MKLIRHPEHRRAKVMKGTVRRARRLQTRRPKTKRHRMRHPHHLPNLLRLFRLTRPRPQRQNPRLPTLQWHPPAPLLQVADNPTNQHRLKVETVKIGM